MLGQDRHRHHHRFPSCGIQCNFVSVLRAHVRVKNVTQGRGGVRESGAAASAITSFGVGVGGDHTS